MSNLEKALRIHQESVVIDAHLDLADELLYRYMNGEEDVIRRYYLDNWKAAGVNLIVSAIFIDNLFLPEMALKNALKQIELLHKDIDLCEGEVVLVKSMKQLDETIASGKIGVMMSLEGLEPFGNEVGMLRIFYELGVRAAGLVWSRRNYAGDGSFFQPREEGRKGGLTDFGVRAIYEMERLGMLVVVSHLNDEGFWDVVNFTRKPFIASHSNARGLVPILRNLDDDQLKAVADSGGVIGINGMKKFLVENPDTQDAVEGICEHIEYMISKVGTDHVGLGFDLYDSLCSCELRFNFGPPPQDDALRSHREMLLITQKLLDRGMEEETIKKILGGNFLRVYRETIR